LENEEIDSYVTRARSRLFALEKPVLPIPTRIAFDNQLSRTDTIMDVETGDRTGLLYDIARTLSDLGADITSAYIVTDRRQVRDAFYLQRQGRKIEDPEALEEIRHALYQVLTTHALT
jgi:[protein-PII] uridylyltransferase